VKAKKKKKATWHKRGGSKPIKHEAPGRVGRPEIKAVKKERREPKKGGRFGGCETEYGGQAGRSGGRGDPPRVWDPT